MRSKGPSHDLSLGALGAMKPRRWGEIEAKKEVYKVHYLECMGVIKGSFVEKLRLTDSEKSLALEIIKSSWYVAPEIIESSWQVAQRVDKTRGEKSWDELRRVKTRWPDVRVVEKSWEEERRGEKRWAEVRRDGTTLRAVENSFENWKELRWSWEELRSGGHNWKGVRPNGDHFTEQNWGAVRVHCISYRQTLSLDPTALHFLNLEISATRLARALLVSIVNGDYEPTYN